MALRQSPYFCFACQPTEVYLRTGSTGPGCLSASKHVLTDSKVLVVRTVASAHRHRVFIYIKHAAAFFVSLLRSHGSCHALSNEYVLANSPMGARTLHTTRLLCYNANITDRNPTLSTLLFAQLFLNKHMHSAIEQMYVVCMSDEQSASWYSHNTLACQCNALNIS